MTRERILRLAAIGTAAGVFSGLFGVGGGGLIVPLLVLWLGYQDREASGTSLAVIAVIAALGAAVQGALGNIDVLDAALVGVPAVAGVLVGTTLQQRVSNEIVGAIFAVLLLGVGVRLVIGG